MAVLIEHLWKTVYFTDKSLLLSETTLIRKQIILFQLSQGCIETFVRMDLNLFVFVMQKACWSLSQDDANNYMICLARFNK